MIEVHYHFHFPTGLTVRVETCPPEVLAEIKLLLQTIMSAVSEFVAKQTEHNVAIDTAIAGLTDDNKVLTDLIKQLQTSEGEISQDDKASLDALEARTAKQAESLAALDALTPPTAPPIAPAA